MGNQRGPRTEAGLAAVAESARQLDHSAWTRNPEAVEAIDIARRLRQTTHGLYASVPIICKAEACPYANSCPLVEIDKAPFGEKCPLEIAAIEDLFSRYCEALSIDPEDRSSTVDLVMVKDIVDADIGLLRCDSKMAWDADYIIQNTVGVSDDGEAITRSELHPLADYREKLINRKHKTLQLLNSTRKDQAGEKIRVESDPSVRAAEMISVLNDMKEITVAEKEAAKSYYQRKEVGEGKDNGSSDGPVEVQPIGFEEDD